MPREQNSPIAKDKLQAALKTLSELVLKFPEKNRGELLQQVELKYDLSPRDCEFLNRHFNDKPHGE